MGYARVRVSVRFLRLGRLQMDELLAHYKHAQAFPSRRAPGEIGVSLPLDDAFDVEWLAGFVERHELPEAERDMFVSLLTNYDTRIVAVPRGGPRSCTSASEANWYSPSRTPTKTNRPKLVSADWPTTTKSWLAQ